MKNKKSLYKIMIVDDHPVVREGLRNIIERHINYTVCGEAADSSQAIRLLNNLKPDLVIIDLKLKNDIDGIELVKAIRLRYGKINTLIISMFDCPDYVERSLKAGAKGYVIKDDISDNIIKAINYALNDKIYLSDELSEKLLRQFTDIAIGKSGINSLSNREFQIFELFGRGYKRGEIAKKLGININTLETHRRKMIYKLNLPNSAELSRTAVSWHVSNSR